MKDVETPNFFNGTISSEETDSFESQSRQGIDFGNLPSITDFPLLEKPPFLISRGGTNVASEAPHSFGLALIITRSRALGFRSK